jgi:hypothetical protein
MYIRFAIEHMNPDSHRRDGLFRGAWRLEEQCDLALHEISELENIYSWFNQHLPRPRRLARSARPSAHHRAICWFKPTAHDHIRQMYRLARLFRQHGIAVTILTTRRPGYIVYQDDAQIVAEPFRDTPA